MMMFSRLGRTISRSRNVLSGRSTGSSVYQSRCIGQADDNLGFLKRYLQTNDETHGPVLSSKLSDINFLLANPRIPRFFSSDSEAHKEKNSEKENKETPKENNQKSKSKRESNIADADMLLHGMGILLLQGLLLKSLTWISGEQKEISFEEFKDNLLEHGLVDHILVISNRSVAKVFVRNSPSNQATTTDEGSSPAKVNTSEFKYYFKIGGSVESFEKTLEEAQEALGIDTDDYVPVTYVSEFDLFKAYRPIAGTTLAFGVMWYLDRNWQRGIDARGFLALGLVFAFIMILALPKDYGIFV